MAVSVGQGSVGGMDPGRGAWSWGLRSGRPADRAGSWNVGMVSGSQKPRIC